MKQHNNLYTFIFCFCFFFSLQYTAFLGWSKLQDILSTGILQLLTSFKNSKWRKISYLNIDFIYRKCNFVSCYITCLTVLIPQRVSINAKVSWTESIIYSQNNTVQLHSCDLVNRPLLLLLDMMACLNNAVFNASDHAPTLHPQPGSYKSTGNCHLGSYRRLLIKAYNYDAIW